MRIYQVGGAVRDKLLNLPSSDRDYVVVGANYAQMLELGFKAVGKHFPVFLHPKTGEEYALARTERKSGKGYGGFTFYADADVSLTQDLMRRDLTINAIAMDEDGNLIDPCNGIFDLNAKILRHVSPAFVEDPLRVLRVARFAARFAHLGFIIAPETMRLMMHIVKSGELAFLSGERIWQEFANALSGQNPHVFIAVLEQCGALNNLMPELKFTTAVVYLQQSSKQESLLVRFACLLFGLDTIHIKNIGNKYKIPHHYIELSLLSHKLNLLITELQNLDASKSPTQIATFLRQADFYRRPQQLLDAITVLNFCTPQHSTITRFMENCAKQTALIGSKDLVAQGFQGKEISTKLNELRTQMITKMCAHFISQQ